MIYISVLPGSIDGGALVLPESIAGVIVIGRIHRACYCTYDMYICIHIITYISVYIYYTYDIYISARFYSGWSLGVAESIAGVIVIGFSVDYTVHLGHIYKEATMYDSKVAHDPAYV